MKTILVPTDFNELATTALRHAVQIARATRAEIVVLYADRFDPPAEFTSRQAEVLVEAIAESRRLAAAELERYAREVVPAAVKVTTMVREDFAVAGILAVADQVGADLIVMGTHGRGGLARLVLGSVTEAVLRETKRPVLTVTRAAAALPIRKVACADTGSSRFAAELAEQLDATMSSFADADLIVACENDHALVRQSRVPVLTVRS